MNGIRTRVPSSKSSRTNFWRGKRIVVTGGAGFLGTHLTKRLKQLKPKEIFVPRSVKYDLRNYKACLKAFNGADIVIHLAGEVGGIGYNRNRPVQLFEDNLLIGVNCLKAARYRDVKKFVGIGTVCSYPKFTPIPFREEDIWNGYPEETNAPYGLAKKMMIVHSKVLRQQYDFNSINLMCVNLYGPGDKFDLKSSHVIPALIRKFLVAKESGKKEVTIWGTGNASREFLYVEDAVEAIILASEKYEKAEPINIGSGKEIPIRALSELIRSIIGFQGKIVWDSSKPDGQPRRLLDVSKAKVEFGFSSKTPFKTGLKKTIEWYKRNGKLYGNPI